MNKKQKVVAIVSGLAFSVTMAAPLVTLPTALANSSQEEITIVDDVTTEVIAIDDITPETTAAAVADDLPEAVIEDEAGQAVQVQIINQQSEKVMAVNERETQTLRAELNSGKKLWLSDPVSVVKNNATRYGFSTKDSFTLVNKTNSNSQVLVRHGSKYYMVTLQASHQGSKSLWQVRSIREVRVAEKQRPNVNTVNGINYQQAIKWQQNVDGGREQWRLDPLSVARNEGKAYGFTSKDSFKVTKRYDRTTRSKYGEVHVTVRQNGVNYTMILVRPFGSDSGAIWVVHSVSGRDKVTTKPVAKNQVLFESREYRDWQWDRNQYPRDMAFTAVVSKQQLTQGNSRIPAAVLNQASKVNYNKDITLFAYLGTMTGSGYDIGIEKVVLNGNTMTVQVRAKSPRSWQWSGWKVSRPADFVTIDRQLVNKLGTVTVNFVDQTGKVLGNLRLVNNLHVN